MTRQEFEERTGCKLTEEAYAPIEAMYLAAGGMDKDEFCRQWVQHGDCALVQELMKTILSLENDKRRYQNTFKNQTELLQSGAGALVAAAAVIGQSQGYLNDLAVRMTSVRWVIKEKLRREIALSQKEINYLEEYLQ